MNSNGYIYFGGEIRNITILLLLTLGLSQDYSLQFDGVDDYVDLGNFGIATTITVIADINLPPNGDVGVIICKDNQDKITIGYLGSADTAYDFKAVVEFYKGFLKFHNDSLLKILTKSNRENILLILNKFNIPKANFMFKHVSVDLI